jgi:minor extracellular serine protease Vpr
MKHRVRGVRLFVLAALVAGIVAVPSALAEEPQGQAEVLGSGLWFVELKSPPTAEGGSQSGVDADKAAFRADAAKAKIGYTQRLSFGKLWNGLSIRTPASPNTLASLPSVKAVYPVLTASVPPGESQPDLNTALAMTGADVAQSELGLDGTGVRVAVMDTGIDYDHPDLGGCFGSGCRVVTGWDFVGDAFNADPTSTAYSPTPVPDANPDDCNGHGTHVAGIVGASGNPTTGGARGVAPGVTFGAYRVFGCEGSTTADIIIAAMERALNDDMDVLNMSIGSSFQWPQYPTAAASDTLVNAGVSVVASIGNSGANGLYAAGAPGLGKKVIGVASYDNTHIRLLTFTVSPDNTSIGYQTMTASPTPPTSGSLPMDRTGTPSSAADACVALPAGSLAGEAALIRRGGCSFKLKALNAQAAGAAAVIIYNNAPGRFAGTLVDPATPGVVTVPVVSISDAEGVLINGRIASGPVTMTWTNVEASFPNPTGGLISSFSSYGLSPDLDVKPDIGAPGGLIRSTVPLEQGGYATISGTSMSSPHVAGGVALLLEARPNTSSQAVRGILQNSADPKLWWGNPGLGFLDNVHRQGAGMLDIDDAILATTKVDPSKLALGEIETGSATRTLTIRNDGSLPVTYDLSHEAALATGPNTFTPSFFNAPSTVAFSAPSVAVPAGGTATVDVTISPNAGLPNRSMFGGYVVLTPQGGGQVYRVPFAGFKGDYQSIQVLTPTANGFPWLARLSACTILRGIDCFVGGTYQRVPPASSVFTMQSSEETDTSSYPYILAHFDHQARRLRVDVFRVSDDKNMGQAINLEYRPRNSTATNFFAFPWDGNVTKGNNTDSAPDDVYYFKLTLTKALGDSSTQETWTSPNFTVDRP